MTDNSTVIFEMSFPEQEKKASLPQLFLQLKLLFNHIIQSD